MKIEKKIIQVEEKAFIFDAVEREILADILMEHVDWEAYRDGEHVEFLSDLYIALEQ